LKVLIVRVSSLGDVVHNMPMVADILRHHPGAVIDWVVEEAYRDLVRLNTGVRRIIPFALRRWRRSLLSTATRAEITAFRRALREEEYDIVFDTQGLFKSGLVMGMARTVRGGKKVGLANGTEGSGYEGISRIFHDISVPVGVHTHAVERARIVAAHGLGHAIDTPADFLLAPPQLQPAWLPDKPYAVFFHGTARAAKQWSPDHWVRVAAFLARRGLPVLLPWGSEEERYAAEAMAARMGNATVLPRLPMMEAVLLAQRCALAVGVDTGLTHIAAAYCRPTVELYVDSPRWKTEGNWSPAVINLGDSGLPPSPELVEQAIVQLLGNSTPS